MNAQPAPSAPVANEVRAAQQSPRKQWRVLAINPGSTSTKIGLFEGETCLLSETVRHSAEKLATFATVSDQLPYRRDQIMALLNEKGVDLSTIDAFVGRGGGLQALPGGTYAVNSTLLHDAQRGSNGIQHPAQLGSQLAHEFALFASPGGKPCFVVNPPDTDELCDLARMTGVKGVYRHVHLHALNLKETAIRHAKSIGKRYEDCNFIVCHLGGGISVSAHQHGRMIDGNDIAGGDGPIAPTRCGSVPVIEMVDYLKTHSEREALGLCMKTGGFVSLLGTSDATEVLDRAAHGDKAAKRAWDAMVYQICKCIGEMACVLSGEVDAILLGGGLAHSTQLVSSVASRCEWIAPVVAYPGEFELEAMAAGARRVLDGEEQALEYTGVPVFTGFDD
ncbi:MAG: butyrate kinase [Tractidigestivibacter sp.]|jgi:butyrate kinase|uniref:butyrate kinase n=1 Tax=Tractidigestivibacter sp. TaxID=2847320 RepID=UPI003D921EE3